MTPTADQIALIDLLIKDIKRDFKRTCSHCGKELAIGGSGYEGWGVTVPDGRMPCNPKYISVCHQPLSNPDWDRSRRLPLMERVCAGTWAFVREFSDGREVFRCRGCDDVLVLTPTFSRAGLGISQAIAATWEMAPFPADEDWWFDNWEIVGAAEHASVVEKELAGYVSLYRGPRSRQPRLT